jgi:hypothetical protein
MPVCGFGTLRAGWSGAPDRNRRSVIRAIGLIVLAVGELVSACTVPQRATEPLEAVVRTPEFGPIHLGRARESEILVIIGGGPVTNKGEHWVPRGATLGGVLEMAGLDPVAPPRIVYVVETDGRDVRHRVAGRAKNELDQVRVNHGSRIIVPYDRCSALGLNPLPAPRPAVAPVMYLWPQWRGVAEAGLGVQST